MCMHVMQAEVSETAHYEAMGFVDCPHPGQGDDFGDEGFVDQPHPGQGEDFDEVFVGQPHPGQKRGEEKSKGHLNYACMYLVIGLIL